MKYTEFEEEVKKLSDKYNVSVDKEDENTIYVGYKDKTILIIYSDQFELNRVGYFDKFERLPFSHKLWMLASELAMTPYDERFDQKRYNVIIGKDRPTSPYMVWTKCAGSPMMTFANFDSLQKYSDYQFTDSEFKDLIKYIKTLHDGEFQAKVAEHGKRLVKGE